MRSDTATPQVESDRIGDVRKTRRAQAAQLDQRHRHLQTLPERANQQRHAQQQARLKAPENRQTLAHQQHSPANPATRAGIVGRLPTPPPRRRVYAVILRKRRNRFRFRQTARKTRRKAVRQRTGRHMAVAAIPPRNPHSRRKLATIRAMTVEVTTIRTAAKAGRGTCLPPCLPANVLFGGQSALVEKLQWPSTARRLQSRGPTLLWKSQDRTQPRRSDQRNPNPKQPGQKTHAPRKLQPDATETRQPTGKERPGSRTALIPDHYNPRPEQTGTDLPPQPVTIRATTQRLRAMGGRPVDR